jgi:predicted ABC-type ATPase
MAELVVVTGPPGAGKSTVAKTLSASFAKSAIVAGDEFFKFLDRGYVSPWLPEADDQNTVVIEAAAAAAGRLVRGGYTVVYDGVVGPWFLDAFALATALEDVHYVVLLPSEDRCVARVQDRVDHKFTDAEATRHMHRQFLNADVASRHLLIDPFDDPANTALTILDRIADSSVVHSRPR